MNETKTLDERKAILERKVNELVGMGWHLVTRTDTSAQFSYTHEPNCLIALICFLFFVLPGILYVLLVRRTENIYVSVDEQGRLSMTRN